MISGWNHLTKVHLGLAGTFILILLSEHANIFTIPVTMAFMMSSAYCALQWHVMNLFKKIEVKHPDWR